MYIWTLENDTYFDMCMCMCARSNLSFIQIELCFFFLLFVIQDVGSSVKKNLV
ncbi:hypothetical protein Hdeb2414_s0009g00322691 [Helianthus debilis subsp. tardiflorus]